MYQTLPYPRPHMASYSSTLFYCRSERVSSSLKFIPSFSLFMIVAVGFLVSPSPTCPSLWQFANSHPFPVSLLTVDSRLARFSFFLFQSFSFFLTAEFGWAVLPSSLTPSFLLIDRLSVRASACVPAVNYIRHPRCFFPFFLPGIGPDRVSRSPPLPPILSSLRAVRPFGPLSPFPCELHVADLL